MARPKRRTMRDHTLGAVIRRAPSEAAVAEPEAPPKKRMTFHLPAEVISRVKNAVYWTPGLTLAELAAQALTEAVDRMEKQRKEAFPPRRGELKGGRPMK